MLIIITIMAVIATAQFSWQASTAWDPYYNAGVVEFRPSTSVTADDRVVDNLQDYLELINSEEATNLDIIVFPESTLNNNDQATFVPNPYKELVVPCANNTSEYHNLLVQLSCAAKRVVKYVVINLTEKELCSAVPEDTRPCAATGLNLYNTNVVFDRTGAVISRYRKVHLYGENKNTTFVPEIGWFDTDFGVRFGHFICFDILFYSPAQVLVEFHGIQDFVFTSMWFSQLPFLSAVQVQQAWSYANDVNLLAAGSSNPLVGSTGTGIYNGRRGILVAKMNQGMGERTLYVAQVPKYRHLRKRSLDVIPKASRLSKPNISLKRDYLQSYETVLVNLTTDTTSLSHEMCFSNTTFCCKFNLKWLPLNSQEKSTHYIYRLGVYNDLRKEVAPESNQLKNCAIFSCIGEDIMDCGQVFAADTEVVFENITITANFPIAEEYLIMPNSLTADLMPVAVGDFKWQENFQKNLHQVRYELNTTTSNLMAFSIYGNYYDTIVDINNDANNDNNGDDGAPAQTCSFFPILGILLHQIF